MRYNEIICCEEPMANKGQIQPKNKPVKAALKKRLQ